MIEFKSEGEAISYLIVALMVAVIGIIYSFMVNWLLGILVLISGVTFTLKDGTKIGLTCLPGVLGKIFSNLALFMGVLAILKLVLGMGL